MAQKFLTNIELEAGLVDGSNSTGTSGYLLSSTGTATSWVDPAAVSVGESEQVHIACKNTSGVAISKGDPVYITGTVGTSFRIQIAAADASNSAKMPAVGLAETDLANNAEGFVIVSGVLKNLTTDPLSTSDGTPSSNDTVYVKAGGGLTITKPTGSGNLIQNVGKVGRVNSANAGSLAVSTIMRTNDVPNLTTGKIWVGSPTYTTESTVVHLDETNDRMGIGTTSPNATLDVNGAGNFSGGTVVSGIDTQTVGVAVAKGTYIKSNDGNYLRNIIGHTSSGNIEIGQTGTALIGDILLRPGSAGNIRFFGTGSEDMRIDSSGNVGIGTTSPAHKLTSKVSANSSYAYYSVNSSGSNRGGIYIDSSGNTQFLGRTGSGTTLQLSASGNSYLNGGSVGIGTSSPGAKLDVVAGDIRLGTNAKYFRVRDTASAQPRVLGMNSANTFYIGPIDSYAGGAMAYGVSGNVTYHGFYGGGGEKVRITSTGNIGVGLTAPQTGLQLYNTTDDTTVGGTYKSAIRLTSTYASTFGGGGELQFGLAPSTAGRDALSVIKGSYSAYSSGNYGGDLEFHTRDADGLGLKQRMTITHDGNVGIGTTNPIGAVHILGPNTNPAMTTSALVVEQGDGAKILIDGNDIDAAAGMLYLNDYSTNDVVFGGQIRVGGGGSPVGNSWFANGNVGIGTTSPSQKLHVAGTGLFSSTLYLGDTNASLYRYFNSLIIQSQTGTSISLGGGPGNVNNDVYVGNGNLEVAGTIEATAATDAYKGYIKNTITCTPLMKTANTSYNYIPYNSTIFNSTPDYFNRMVTPYDGRVKKIILRHISGTTPTATGMKFKKEVNGTVGTTEYTATVTGGASTSFTAIYNFANSDFTFSEGDSIGILAQTSGGTGNIGGASAQIIVEYNIT